ncbi:MAG TPA: hypothetical protein VNN80_09735 [Polyangiaceae bacterium]|nr:hypothetical protein [Polyangiaceae bacterium]
MRGRAGTATDTNSTAVAVRASLIRLVRRASAVRLAWLAVSVALFAAGPAAAQTQSSSTDVFTTLSSPNGGISMVTNAQGITRKYPYYTNTKPWWINYNDCVGRPWEEGDYGDVFTFSIKVVDNSNPLEVWAGTENCATSRSRTDRGQCWIVARVSQLSDSVDVQVPVRNVLLRNLNDTDPPAVTPSRAVCDNSTDPSGEAITFYFMLVDGGQADEYFAWDGGSAGTGFDVVGPAPPGSISVGIGESQLAVNIDDVPEETDRESFEAFCVPAGTTCASLGIDCTIGPDADAGASASDGQDAGTSGGGGLLEGRGAPAACFTEVLRTSLRPPPEYSCGTARETSSTLSTTRLQNDVNYAVAVAGQDSLGNAGDISEIKCGTPTELDDFFELYSRAGGRGGGGFCSLSPGRVGATSRGGLALLLLVGAGLGLRRRKGAP